MQYANGDVFQGCWAADDKHGEGTFFYEEKAARYDGVWAEGTARCGEYQAVDPALVPQVQLPCLELLGADEVMARAKTLAMRRT